MPAAPDELRESPTPAPAELVERAAALVRRFPECFWYWHPDTQVRNLEDVRLVIERLRQHGDRRAWWAAQELHKCLLPYYKRKS